MQQTFAIHKFVIQKAEEHEILMPRSARILHVETQPQPDGELILCAWALVLKADPPQPRKVRVIATGESLSSEVVEHFEHVATVQEVGVIRGAEAPTFKSIVHHVFMEKPPVN